MKRRSWHKATALAAAITAALTLAVAPAAEAYRAMPTIMKGSVDPGGVGPVVCAQFFMNIRTAWDQGTSTEWNRKRLWVDGVFGASTLEVTKAYQNLVALSSDGVIGTNTWHMIQVDLGAIYTYGKQKWDPSGDLGGHPLSWYAVQLTNSINSTGHCGP